MDNRFYFHRFILERLGKKPASSGLVNPYVPYDFCQLTADLKKLTHAYPAFFSLGIAGYSVKKRPLFYLRMGQGQRRLLLVGAHHAREYITSAYLMRFAEDAAQLYATRPPDAEYNAHHIFEQVQIYLLPMLNPDGVELSIHGEQAATPEIQNMIKIHGDWAAWKANARGVDLNRQYPCFFEEKHSTVLSPASEMYKGSAPATEPEVQALMALTKAVPFQLAATFHAKGEEIFYADENTPELLEASHVLATRIARETGYALAPVSADPAVYGAGFENWFRSEYMRPCLLFELTPYTGGSLPHDMLNFDTLLWEKAKNICFILAEFLLL